MFRWARTRPSIARSIRWYSAGVKDYYEVLEVSKTASTREIKQAFYKMSKKYHPDVVGSDSKKFIEVKEAYDILRDPQKRKEYDLNQSGGHRYQNFSQNPYGYQQGYRVYRRDINPEDFDRIMKEMDEVFKRFNGGQNVKSNRFWGFRREFNQKEFDKIWNDFRSQTFNRSSPNLEEMFRRAKERASREYDRQRDVRWDTYQDEKKKEEPWNNPVFKMSNYIDMEKYLRYLKVFTYVAVLSAFLILISEDHHKFAKPKRLFDEPVTDQERIRKMMEKPPVYSTPQSPNYSNNSDTQPVDPVFPMGFPSEKR